MFLFGGGYVQTENEYRSSTKTEEELIKLTLEENMTEVKRSYHILSKGHNFQKHAIYKNLHHILQESDGCSTLLPLIYEDIQNQEEDIQIETADSLVKAIQIKFFKDDVLMYLFKMTLQMLKIWSQPVLDAWIKVFNELLNVIKHSQIEEEINKAIIYLSDKSQPTVSRYIAGRMIGFISEIRKQKIQGPMFDRARILCEDVDFDVRKAMASEVILKISKNISQEMIEIFILEKALHLVYDSEINVKCAGIKLIFDIVPLLSLEEKKNRMCKIFIELVSSTNEDVLRTMSHLVGKVFQELQPFLIKNPNQMQVIFQALKDYSKHKDPIIRQNFAYNFPGIFQLTDIKTFEKLKKCYLGLLQSDDNIQVRQMMISSLHSIAEILGLEESYKNLADVVCILLKDKDPAIMVSVANRIDLILKNVIPIPPEKSDEEDEGAADKEDEADYKDFFDEILIFLNNICEQKHNWRLREIFYNKIGNVLHYFDLQKFYLLFYPVLQKNLEGTNRAENVALIRLIVKFISFNYFLDNTKTILNFFHTNYRLSKSYKERIKFIVFYEEASHMFSRNFFKKYQLHKILDFVEDKVPNLRIALCRVLVRVRWMIDDEDEDEEETLQNFTLMLKKLTLDFDADVKKEAIKAQQEFTEIDFYSEKATEELNSWNTDRMRKEEELEQLQGEYLLKNKEDKSLDDIDIDFKSDFFTQGMNYHHYKKRYSKQNNYKRIGLGLGSNSASLTNLNKFNSGKKHKERSNTITNMMVGAPSTLNYNKRASLELKAKDKNVDRDKDNGTKLTKGATTTLSDGKDKQKVNENTNIKLTTGQAKDNNINNNNNNKQKKGVKKDPNLKEDLQKGDLEYNQDIEQRVQIVNI